MDKKSNYFFEVYEIISEEAEQCLGMKHIRLDSDFKNKIFPQDSTFTCEFKNDDGNIFKYGYNIKQELIDKCPDVINELCESFGTEIIGNDNIGICLISSYDYRQYDKQYDNECRFVEYMMSEKSKEDKETEITEEILTNAGFVQCNDLAKRIKDGEEISKYIYYRIWTSDDYIDINTLKLDISKEYTNRLGAHWHLHIDNNTCQTIGSADINTVWEFNTLMEVFGSKFRL